MTKTLRTKHIATVGIMGIHNPKTRVGTRLIYRYDEVADVQGWKYFRFRNDECERGYLKWLEKQYHDVR